VAVLVFRYGKSNTGAGRDLPRRQHPETIHIDQLTARCAGIKMPAPTAKVEHGQRDFDVNQYTKFWSRSQRRD
jgi:hypothetical protein